MDTQINSLAVAPIGMGIAGIESGPQLLQEMRGKERDKPGRSPVKPMA